MKKLNYKMSEFIAELFIDIAAVFVSGVLCLVLVLSYEMDALHWMEYYTYLFYALPCLIVVYLLCRVYVQMWQFVRVSGLLRLLGAGFIFTLLIMLFGYLFHNLFPAAFYPLNWMCVVGIGWLFRARKTIMAKIRYHVVRVIPMGKKSDADGKSTLIVGAGEAASLLVEQYQTRRGKYVKIVGMVDDDRSKAGMTLHSIKVLGSSEDIPDLVRVYDVQDIIVAIPSANKEQMAHILEYCNQTECRVRIMPYVDEAVDFNLRSLRTPDISDLIGREEFHMNQKAIHELLKNKVILVTGGGGSIGSELCRQIMMHDPEKLIIYDMYENNVYDLHSELVEEYGEWGREKLILHIGSVCSSHDLDEVFDAFHPQLVFHAAAYKHVPLMEICPEQAVSNNIFGTYKLACAAQKYKAEKFLLISTDKAVNPTNVMGATKRAAELIVQTMQQKESETDFVAVRFGNVLGSNGSAVIQFRRQIEKGGPVLVTHPDIIRYFMTIGEAVSLVLETMSLAEGGELFVLDMGKPVKIDDLARKMIEMAGLRPGIDIDIAYVGLRPGEKLYEELLIDAEGIRKTQNEKIFITRPVNFGEEYIQNMLKEMEQCLYKNENIRKVLKKYIPSYKLQKIDS